MSSSISSSKIISRKIKTNKSNQEVQKPNKNEHSHVGDAFMYLLLGGGEHKRLTRGGNKNFSASVASADFDIFA